MKRIALLLLTAMLLSACHTEKKATEQKTPESEAIEANDPTNENASHKNVEPKLMKASPRVIIYKMKKNYSKKVPVILSKDKKTIVSYPHPRDIYTNGILAVPTALKNGYWLDNRGINENVAFLSYTYEEYAEMTDVPPIDVLYKKIVDKDPITEMWVCGSRNEYPDIVGFLNKMITNNDLDKKFKRIK